MSKVTKPNGAASKKRPDGPIVGVEEARDLYPGKWVLMEVTEFDHYHRSKNGIVLFASKSRKRINDELFKLGKPSEWLPQGRSVFIFHTTPGDDPFFSRLFGPTFSGNGLMRDEPR